MVDLSLKNKKKTKKETLCTFCSFLSTLIEVRREKTLDNNFFFEKQPT